MLYWLKVEIDQNNQQQLQIDQEINLNVLIDFILALPEQ